MRPDVALIAPYPPAGQRHGGHSGVASYTANLARALADRGRYVTVVAPHLDGDPHRFRDGAVTVERAFPLGRGALGTAFEAATATGAPVRHLQWELFLYGGPAALAGLSRLVLPHPDRAPLVTTLHQVVDAADVDRSYTALHRVTAPPIVARTGIRVVQRALQRASAATIVHEGAFSDILGGAAVIPHGVESVPPGERRASRLRLGVDRDAFVALCFGFLAPYKGLETALEAAALAGPAVQLVVAGGEHPRLAAAAPGYADALAEAAPHARFTGYVPDEEVAPWFAAADVVLLPYPRPFASSGPLALALAHRVPLLLSPALARCTGAPSALQVPNDPALLAQRLLQLCADSRALAELAHWTGVLADGRAWATVAERTVALYEEVTRGCDRSGRRLRAA